MNHADPTWSSAGARRARTAISPLRCRWARRGMALAAIAMLFPVPAAQAEAPTREPTFDRISFSVEASDEVQNDTLVAVVAAQREGTDAAAAAGEVNELAAWALSLAKELPDVDVRTLGYRTSPVYRNKRIDGWRVRQAVELRSSESSVLTDLLGQLQSRMTLESVRYELSRPNLLRHEEQLVAEVLESYAARADAIAARLGRPGYRLVSMNLGSDYARPPHPMPRAMAMAAESRAQAPPPVVEGGAQTVRVNAHVTIELLPAQ